MAKIVGIDVVLHQRIQTSTNNFNEPVYSDSQVTVHNVLVAPTTSDDVIDQHSLEGRKEIYTLAIPKGDTNEWENQLVEFWGKTFKVFGIPQKGIVENIPLDWNMKVTVERYE